MTSLKQQTINGMFWTVSERFITQIALMVTSIILARLLTPADFGLLGMLSIFTAIAQSVIDSGYGSALIQKTDANQTDASSIFFFNLFVGFSIAIILFLVAPLIAKFYNQPILIPLTRTLSLNMIITAFSLVQTSLLTKNMNFNIQFKVSLISVLTSGTIGILMAHFGYGVWSLVAQLIIRQLMAAIMLWFLSSWKPSLVFSFDSLKSMFSFGSRLLISGLVGTVFNNIYNTFIGKFFSAEDLGFYSKASTLEKAATQSTSSALSKVTYAAFAPFQDNNYILKQSYRKTARLSMFVHSPIMIGLVVIADPLIRFLLTDKWAPSIPYFQLFCFIGLFVPMDKFNNNILKVKGRTDISLRLQVVRKTFTVLAIVITYRWGITALLIGQIITSIFNFIINGHYSDRLIGYSRIDQIKDLVPSLLTSIGMGVCVYLLTFISFSSLLHELLILTISGTLIYTGIHRIISSPELIEIGQIIENILKSIIKKIKRIYFETISKK